jgi:hypothetical protein
MGLGQMDLLVEEFYDGEEIDLDILVQDNKVVFVAISDNFPQEEPNFYEKGVITPSTKIPRDEVVLIEKILEKWIPKLNLQNACCNLEAFCRPKHLYPNQGFDSGLLEDPENVKKFLMPIEVNLRMGGAEKCSMITAAYGINLFNQSIHLKLGSKPEDIDFRFYQLNPRFNCMSKKYFPVSSEIRNISVDMMGIVGTSNIVELAIIECVGRICSDDDYTGWVAVKNAIGCSYESFLYTLESYMKLVNFEYK